MKGAFAAGVALCASVAGMALGGGPASGVVALALGASEDGMALEGGPANGASGVPGLAATGVIGFAVGVVVAASVVGLAVAASVVGLAVATSVGGLAVAASVVGLAVATTVGGLAVATFVVGLAVATSVVGLAVAGALALTGTGIVVFGCLQGGGAGVALLMHGFGVAGVGGVLAWEGGKGGAGMNVGGSANLVSGCKVSGGEAGVTGVAGVGGEGEGSGRVANVGELGLGGSGAWLSSGLDGSVGLMAWLAPCMRLMGTDGLSVPWLQCTSFLAASVSTAVAMACHRGIMCGW